jgi:hypothetical protein
MKFLIWKPGAKASVLILSVLIFLALAVSDLIRLAERQQLRTPAARGLVVPAPRAANMSALAASAASAVTAPVASIPAPVVYDYKIPDGYTMTWIERETCNPIDDIVNRNKDNPAVKSRDTIIAGGVITLLKMEGCSPALAKSKTSPENVLTSKRRASRDKSFASRHEPSDPLNTDVSVTNCANAAWRIKDKLEKLFANTKCIEKEFGELIREAIAVVDPSVSYFDVVAMMYIESKGYVRAINSRTDCHGLMQLQTPTAHEVGVRHIYNAKENILGGVRVLSQYTKEFGGSRAHGVAAYNMGNGKLRKILAQWPKYDPGVRNPYFLEVERIRAALEG